MMPGLRAEIALLSAGMIVAAAPLSAGYAEEADQEPEPPATTRPATHAEEPRPPSKAKAVAGRELRLQKRQNWWDHARGVLFTDIEISDEQAREVDAIIDEQLDKRDQQLRRDGEFNAARKSRDPERIEAARSALSASREQLKEPHEIYETLRALLSEEQRPKFDMNRARHIAESQTTP
jgi:hypothetical protein